ncbi:MAG: TonB-dependent receptor [Verrucomicrobiota bacterium]
MRTHWHGRTAGRCRQIVVFVAVLTLVLSVEVLAQGFRNPPEGAAALGKAGGKIVFVDDATAISHNPANLADLREPQALAALTILNAKTEYTAPGGQKADTEDPWKFLPNLYGVWPGASGKLVAGIGITTPFGQSTEWSKTGAFRYTAPYFAQLRAVNFNPTVAAKLGDSVSLGVGADVLWSDLNLKQVFPWSAVAGPAAPDGEAKFSGDGVGFGGNIGLTWQMAEKHRLALTYRSPVSVDYEGDFKISGTPAVAFLPPPLRAVTARSDFDAEIKFPAVAALGYGIQATDQLRCEANVEWIEFSSYDTLALDAGNNNVLLPSATIPQDWKDVWTFGAGADWQVNPNLVLRAGYLFIESPIPDDTLSPTLPDVDRHALSVGISCRQGAHTLDIAYVYSLFDKREIRDNQNPAYNGEYDISSHILGASWSYVF